MKPAHAAIWYRANGDWKPRVYKTSDPDFRIALLAAMGAGPAQARIEYLDPRSPLISNAS